MCVCVWRMCRGGGEWTWKLVVFGMRYAQRSTAENQLNGGRRELQATTATTVARRALVAALTGAATR